MKKLALAAMAAIGAVCAQAEAAVYTFTPTSIGPSLEPLYNLSTPAFTISINDATVMSGSFSYDYRYRYDPIANTNTPSAVGDVQALQLFQAAGGRISFAGGSGPQATSSDYFSVNLMFTSIGQISSGRVLYGDDSFGIDVTGTSQTFTGEFFTGFLNADTVIGVFSGGSLSASSVPEPQTIGLLGIALVGLFVIRRRSLKTTLSLKMSA